MKNWMAVLSVFFSACIWREPKQDACSRELTLEGDIAITIAVGDPPWGGQEASDEAALTACRMWESVGISCSVADSLENADVYVDFYEDWDCGDAGHIGILGDFHDRRPGIWLNGANVCLPSEGVREWFIHLVTHEIGHMLGIEDTPAFCGDAVMNPAIERGQPTTVLSAITETDLRAFAERNHRSLLLGGETVLDCGDGSRETDETPTDIPVEEIDSDPLTANLWLEPAILPWSNEILNGCSWWSPVHLSCALAPSRREAEVIVRNLTNTCGVAGFTYYDWQMLNGRYIVEINIDCMPSDPDSASNWMRQVAAHELAHTQGVGHVPFFCGEAIMNPALTNRTSISSADVSAWRERYEDYLK